MSRRGPVLMVDIGNTRIKWALKEGDDDRPVSQVYACYHQDLCVFLSFLLSFRDTWTAAVIANVSPSSTVKTIVSALKHSVCPLVYKPGVWRDLPLCSLSSRAWAPILGADRFAAVVAALDEEAMDALVVNCGTCMTLDAVQWLGQSGRLVGGHIVPGMDILFRAMSQRLPHLDIVNTFFPPECWGRDTMSCIALGVWDAAIGAVLCQYHRFTQGLPGRSIRLVVSGGNGAYLMQGLRYFLPTVRIDYRPALVLDGLFRLYKQYREGISPVEGKIL